MVATIGFALTLWSWNLIAKRTYSMGLMLPDPAFAAALASITRMEQRGDG